MSMLKRYVAGFCLMMLMSTCMLGFVSTVSMHNVYAEGIEDNLGGNEDGELSGGSISQDDQDVANWIKDQRGMTGKQLETAGNTLGPITNILGYIVGGIVVLTFAGVFVITALDLLYITIPPIRNLLYKAGTDGTGAFTGGMPGGGYGMRGGYGGGMMGAGGAANGTAKPTQWISDEAVACAALLGGSAQATQGGMMGGYGGGMMGGAYGGMQPQQPMPMKSVLATYFKKRIFFMILLAICAIVLTSSILLGTGVNLAKWILKIVDMMNGYIPN